MKNLFQLLLFPLFALIFISCGAADTAEDGSTTSVASENPEIHIQIDGLNNGLIRLVGIFTDQQYVVDTTSVNQSGQAVFKKDEPYRQGYYYVLLPNNANFQILITEDQTFEIHTNINDLVGTMKVTGQVDNSLFYENLKFEPSYQNRYQAVINQMTGLPKDDARYNSLESQRKALVQERRDHLEELFIKAPKSLFTTFKTAGQNPDLRQDLPEDEQVYWYRHQFWDSVDFTDERLLYTPVISNKLKRYITELTPQNPDSILAATDHLIQQLPTLKDSEYFKYFANWITMQYEPAETTLMDAEAVYVNMVKKYFTYEHAFWADSTNTYALQLRADEMANSLVGQAGPNVKAPDLNGEIKAIYDLEAPYIVVYLYNPDCEHCMEQSPVLVQLYNKWQQDKKPMIDVYAIAIDTNAEEWKQYVAKTNMRWTNVFDPTNKSIYKTYYVNVTPEVYVLDADRKIIAKNLNVNQIEEVVRRDQEKKGM